MNSRRVLVGAAAVGAAAALCAVATPALATPGFPGYALTSGNGGTVSSATGSIGYLASQSGALSLTVNGIILTCASNSGSTASGTVNRGTYTTNQVGSITNTKFGSGTYTSPNITTGSTPCTTTNGTVPVAVSGPTSSAPWAINVTGVSTTQPNPQGVPQANQVTPGSITNIKATVYVGKTNSCVFQIGGTTSGSYAGSPTVAGSVTGTYKNTAGTGTLSPDGTGTNLRVWGAPSGGCVGGAITNGQVATFSGAYSVAAVSPATNAIWVRS